MVLTYGAIRMGFTKSNHKKVPGYLASAIFSEEATKEYKRIWDTMPVGSHLIQDFKKLRKDQNGNVPYKVLVYTDAFGNKMKALVRHLYEIDDMDPDQPECQEYYETYTDLIHANQCFMVIKIVPEDSYNYSCKDHFKLTGSNSYEFEPFSNVTPIPEDGMSDADNSTPLFD